VFIIVIQKPTILLVGQAESTGTGQELLGRNSLDTVISASWLSIKVFCGWHNCELLGKATILFCLSPYLIFVCMIFSFRGKSNLVIKNFRQCTFCLLFNQQVVSVFLNIALSMRWGWELTLATDSTKQMSHLQNVCDKQPGL